MRNEDLTRLYSEHAESLYAFLSYRIGDAILAEDLMADTFERAFRSKRGHDRRKASERTWLYAIALNCVRDNARRISAENRALTHIGVVRTDSQLDTTLDGLALKDALRRALGDLSDQEREAIALRFGADLTLADIAAILDLPRSRIEARIYRALKKLRSGLSEDLGVAAPLPAADG